MRPERRAGVFPRRSRPPIPAPIPFVDPWRRAVGVASARPRYGAVPGTLGGAARSAAALIAAKRAVPAHFLQNGARAPSGSGTPANSLFFRPIRRKRVADCRAKAQGLLSFRAGFCVTTGRARRAAAVPKSEAVQGVARSAARRGRPSRRIFYKKVERSVQIREAGQPSVFPARSRESNTERSRKNEGRVSGSVPVRLAAACLAFQPFFVVGIQAAGLSPPLTHPETAGSARVPGRKRWRLRSRRRRGA